MNDFIVSIYEPFLDYDLYSEFLGKIYNNGDFATIGYIIFLLPLVGMFAFYKFWDPVRKQILWWSLSLALIALVSYGITTSILYKNNDLLALIGDTPEPDGRMLIVNISMTSLFYAAVISFIYSLIIKRFFSSNNSHNPF
jgi:hypothetical protein